MALATRTPTTRILTLVALFMAAGVLSLRAVDLFTGPAQVSGVGSANEQALTGLLEPITGAGNVRVAIRGKPVRTFLILVNGEQTATQTSQSVKRDIETIVTAATGYKPERDILTISQFPFAKGAGGELSALEMVEFTALALLCALLIALLAAPARASVKVEDDKRVQADMPPANLHVVKPEPVLAADNDIDRAAQIAANDPSGTVRLIREWIGESEGGRS